MITSQIQGPYSLAHNTYNYTDTIARFYWLTLEWNIFCEQPPNVARTGDLEFMQCFSKKTSRSSARLYCSDLARRLAIGNWVGAAWSVSFYFILLHSIAKPVNWKDHQHTYMWDRINVNLLKYFWKSPARRAHDSRDAATCSQLRRRRDGLTTQATSRRAHNSGDTTKGSLLRRCRDGLTTQAMPRRAHNSGDTTKGLLVTTQATPRWAHYIT